MRVALVLFFVLTSLSLLFATQEAPRECRGKVLPIQLLPGQKMTGPPLPLRFGGTREYPRYPINSFLSEKPFRLVIKTREEFADFWKRFTDPLPPSNGIPPPPEVDFSKDMVIISVMGMRPSSGYSIFIDGACEVDGKVEVFVNSFEGGASCGSVFGVVTYPADAVRLPRTDLPVVFRETEISCAQWRDRFSPDKH